MARWCWPFLFLLTACAHYRAGEPGATGASAARVYYLEPVVNRSYAPQLSALLDADLVEAFTASGATVTRDRGEADQVVEVVVQGYARDPGATNPQDSGRRLSYGLALDAGVVVRGAGGAKLWEGTVSADTAVITFSSLPEEEYQALPQLSEELSRRIRDAVRYRW